MSVIKEVLEGIEMVAKAIKNIKEIQKAIKDGREYLTKKHPDTKSELKGMLTEMQNTCGAIAEASALITHFSFNGSPGAIDTAPDKFNQHFIETKSKINNAENIIMNLKGHCHIIRNHADNIRQKEGKDIWSLLGLNSQEKEHQIANGLMTIYNDEMDFHSTVYEMSKSLQLAIDDVANTLETDGLMLATNVPAAAQKLSEYKKHFRQLEKTTKETYLEIKVLADSL